MLLQQIHTVDTSRCSTDCCRQIRLESALTANYRHDQVQHRLLQTETSGSSTCCCRQTRPGAAKTAVDIKVQNQHWMLLADTCRCSTGCCRKTRPGAAQAAVEQARPGAALAARVSQVRPAAAETAVDVKASKCSKGCCRILFQVLHGLQQSRQFQQAACTLGSFLCSF